MLPKSILFQYMALYAKCNDLPEMHKKYTILAVNIAQKCTVF